MVLQRSAASSSGNSGKKRSNLSRFSLTNFKTFGVLFFTAFIVITVLLHYQRVGSSAEAWFQRNLKYGPVLVSYSYFEKDPVQKRDFDFFIAVGMGIKSSFDPPKHTHFSIVINGDVCTPCSTLYSLLQDVPVPEDQPWLKEVKLGKGLTYLWRNENEGMDFAAHNATLEWYLARQQLKRYKYFLFLNSSIRGPFYPIYMPTGWQWTRAYTDLLSDTVKAVSSSIVCLPALDAGGYGAKVESWAFALDAVGLKLLMNAGTFSIRTCKLCTDGVVVQGEYGITNVLFSKGYNIATLMSKYDRNTDWRESKNWRCNNNAHPSRHGTYDSISMNPYEVVFLKASWHVGEPYIARYTEWLMDKAEGRLTTRGHFDEAMYRYAIQPEAQDEPGMGPCFDVLNFDVRSNTPLNNQPRPQQASDPTPNVQTVQLQQEEQPKPRGKPLEPIDQPTFGKPIMVDV